MRRRLEVTFDGCVRQFRYLALPVALLLCLQWPLRDVVQAYSREANDFGQWLFALFVAASITAATRARAHLATDVVARGRPPARARVVARLGTVLGLAPWLILIAWAGSPLMLSSALQLERFPDTLNPGYFIIKLALGVLVILAAIQMLLGDPARGPVDGTKSTEDNAP